MKKITILLILLFQVSVAVFSQESRSVISGLIVDNNNQPLSGINVILKENHTGSVTDGSGNFRISNVKAGKYVLKASGVGFEPVEKQILVTAGEDLVINFTLTSANSQLQEVTITEQLSSYKTDTVSSTLRLQTPLLEIPQNIQVINKSLLEDQRIFDMLEGVTRNVSGVTRGEHWDNYALIMMRGSQIPAFRNGMNVQMPFGPLTQDMSMVERIEFVKGPAGFMLASGEPGGFYNVVTKKPFNRAGAEANFTLGSFDTYRASLDINGKPVANGKLQYRINLMGQEKGSFRPYEFNNRYSIVPVIRYIFNENTSLTAEYTYQHVQSSVIGSNYSFSPKGFEDLPYDFTTAEANLDPTVIRDQSLFLTLHHKINSDWQLTGQLAYLNYNQTGSSLWPIWQGLSANGDLKRGISIWDALGLGKMGQVFVNGNVTTGAVRHRILGGLDMSNKQYYADWATSYALNGTKTFNIYKPEYGNVPADSLPAFNRSKDIRNRGIRYDQSYSALYLQDELLLLDDKLRLTIAGRYTSIKDLDPYAAGIAKDEKFTPRFGLSYSVNKETSVYGVYDQSFIAQAGTDYSGKGFDPLTGTNIEFGAKKDWFDGKWNTTLSAYRITKNNVLTSDPEHLNFSIQLGQTQVQGIEFDLRGEIAKGLKLTFNYALTDSKVTKDTDPIRVGVPVPGTAKHITNAWLSYVLPEGTLKGIGLSLGYQWQIERLSWYVFDGTKQQMPDYFRLDGGLNWQSNRFRVSLNVNNLLNEYLYSGGPYYGMYFWQSEPKRNFRLNLGYKF
jgi:iron complex outermembrane receptor protein